MARTISFRIPDELAAALAERTAPWRLASESDAYRRILEEWLAMQKHPGIRFVDGPAGRRAALVDGPDVWEVIMAGRSLDLDVDRMTKAFHWLGPDRVKAALAYYDDHRDEIDEWIELNDRMAEELQAKLRVVPD